MEKCLFIVEDKTKDIGGLLLALQATLLNARRKDGGEQLDAGDLFLFFLHICWTDGEEKAGRVKFEKEMETVRERMGKVQKTAFPAEYCPIRLGNDGYGPDSCPDYGQRVLDEQKRLMEEALGRKIKMPDPGEPCYAVLLDVVLNERKDEDQIRGGGEVLSSWLYRKYTSGRCAAYSEYPAVGVCQKWEMMTALKDEIIRREYLSRGRAVYLPLKRKLYQALELE